jgi:multiple sugar transport system permease protein
MTRAVRPTAPGLDRRRAFTGVILTFPALAALAATMLYPIAWTFWISLNGKSYALSGKPAFVGAANYLRVFANADFLDALLHTLGFVLAALLIEAAIALPIALALHRGLRGTRIFQAVVAMPLMVAPVVGALAWRWMFVSGYGMIDSIMSRFGGHGPLWFADIWLARMAIVITNLWLALPFDILMLVAGLASLPSEPLEAALVDGASPLQTLRLVTLPLLRPVIAIILVIRLADAFRIFDVVYVLTGSGPGNSTDVLSTFIYRQMFFKFDFAGGSAASILLVTITALASLMVVAGLRRRSASALS